MDERQQMNEDEFAPETERAEDLEVDAEQADDVKGGAGSRYRAAAPFIDDGTAGQ